MQTYQSKTQPDQRTSSGVMLPLSIGVLAFAVGGALTFGYVKWNAQQEKLAFMTEMVERLGEQRPYAPGTASEGVVTRNEPMDLINVGTSAGSGQGAMAQPALAQDAALVTAPVATPAPVATVAAAEPAAADTLRAPDPTATTAPAISLDDMAIEDARRLETLAIIHAGVEELVQAVVDGQYDIHTKYKDEDFSGRIHFAFVGRENDQKELERFLSDAAENGIIAHSKSVVDGQGKVNGHILLFELVERALENGTLTEQRAGDKMRRDAVALLAEDAVVGTAANVGGERFYTVESGDSLAYISLQFYGNIDSYTKIFEANRNQLKTPDRIQVGQRLRIPNA